MKPKHLWIVIIGILLFLIVGFNTCNSEMEPNEPDNVDHVLNAQNFVKKNLKAPSTAKFPPTTTARVYPTGTDSYRVHSYVDSQNGFGAMLRSDWVVEFRYVGSDKVELIKINIE